MIIRAMLAAVSLTAATHAAAPWWQALGPVQRSEYGGGHVDDGDSLTPEQKVALKATSFAEWEVYEDEWVKLRYPKHPEVKFRVSKGGDGLKVEGGVVTTVDNSFQQAYILEVGKSTYGVFLLQPAKWLDDGICLCGPMVHHAYSMRDGCLARYSLLPGGAVKKAQVLGGGIRLMAFEWTHLACPREIYEQLVDGMTVKVRHPWGEERLREKIVKDYGFGGKTGWLHPGQSATEMIALMGEPKTREDTRWTWQERWGDYLAEAKADVQDGAFVRLEGNGADQVGGPLEGSLDWAEENAGEERNHRDRFAGEPGDKPKEKPARPTPEAVAVALKELAPTCHGNRWRTWCDSVVSLSKHRNHRDPSLLEIVKGRSAARSCELNVLKSYEDPGLKAWVGAGLATLAALDFPREEEDSPVEDSAPWRSDDAEDLLAWQAEHDLEAVVTSARLLLGARKHAWAEAVLSQGEMLPPDLGTEVLVQSLGFAIKEEDEGLADTALTMLPKIQIGDPTAVRKLVEKLPEGEVGSEWHEQRMDALKALALPPEKPGD
jgi:hypothetical protein